jgi:hypothetical protein
MRNEKWVRMMLSVSILSALAAMPMAVNCRGVGCQLLLGAQVLGPAREAVRAGTTGIKERGLDAVVLHQATDLGAAGNRIGQPTAPPPPPSIGHVCVAPTGPGSPSGTPCWDNAVHGEFPGTVVP